MKKVIYSQGNRISCQKINSCINALCAVENTNLAHINTKEEVYHDIKSRFATSAITQIGMDGHQNMKIN